MQNYFSLLHWLVTAHRDEVRTLRLENAIGAFNTRWPLYTVYPCAAAFFWLSYLVLLPAFSRWAVPVRYGKFNAFNERCWRQNLNSLLHTSLAVCLLCAVLLTDDEIFSRRLYQHDNLLLYFDISLSLGYFTFALPMSVYMAFVLKAGFPYGSPIMSLHHTLVVLAQATFLLTQYPAFYMAASGALFELTNVFFIPHVLMIQLEVSGPLQQANGLLLVLAYTVFRVVACTAICVLSLGDFASFTPPHPSGWAAALVAMGCLYGLTTMSWYWYVRDIVPALHAGLQETLGDEYHHTCCSAPLRQWAWRTLTAEGREHARLERGQHQQQLELLRHLRATSTAGSSSDVQVALHARNLD